MKRNRMLNLALKQALLLILVATLPGQSFAGAPSEGGLEGGGGDSGQQASGGDPGKKNSVKTCDITKEKYNSLCDADPAPENEKYREIRDISGDGYGWNPTNQCKKTEEGVKGLVAEMFQSLKRKDYGRRVIATQTCSNSCEIDFGTDESGRCSNVTWVRTCEVLSFSTFAPSACTDDKRTNKFSAWSPYLFRAEATDSSNKSLTTRSLYASYYNCDTPKCSPDGKPDGYNSVRDSGSWFGVAPEGDEKWNFYWNAITLRFDSADEAKGYFKAKCEIQGGRRAD